jgi:hypothetical protein
MEQPKDERENRYWLFVTRYWVKDQGRRGEETLLVTGYWLKDKGGMRIEKENRKSQKSVIRNN